MICAVGGIVRAPRRRMLRFALSVPLRLLPGSAARCFRLGTFAYPRAAASICATTASTFLRRALAILFALGTHRGLCRQRGFGGGALRCRCQQLAFRLRPRLRGACGIRPGTFSFRAKLQLQSLSFAALACYMLRHRARPAPAPAAAAASASAPSFPRAKLSQPLPLRCAGVRRFRIAFGLGPRAAAPWAASASFGGGGAAPADLPAVRVRLAPAPVRRLRHPPRHSPSARAAIAIASASLRWRATCPASRSACARAHLRCGCGIRPRLSPSRVTILSHIASASPRWSRGVSRIAFGLGPRGGLGRQRRLGGGALLCQRQQLAFGLRPRLRSGCGIRLGTSPSYAKASIAIASASLRRRVSCSASRSLWHARRPGLPARFSVRRAVPPVLPATRVPACAGPARRRRHRPRRSLPRRARLSQSLPAFAVSPCRMFSGIAFGLGPPGGFP